MSSFTGLNRKRKKKKKTGREIVILEAGCNLILEFLIEIKSLFCLRRKYFNEIFGYAKVGF